MSIKIDRASIQKLGHETQEIRLRTLEQIENKVARALTHNERIDFRPGELIKYLIRWFAFQPLQAKDVVLNLIMIILKSPYRQEVIDYLGEERLKKELGKVKILVKSTPEVQLVAEILTMLEKNVNEVIEISDSLSISDSYDSLSIRDLDIGDNNMGGFSNDMGYEIAWSKASVPDYNSLKVISDILKTTNSSASDLHNALQHIQITIDDYPAEYFLQPPHIFQNLLELFESGSSAFEDLSETFICICKSLLGRLRTRRKAVAFFSSKPPGIPVRTQLSVSTVCFRLLELCMSYLKFNLFTIEKSSFNVFRLIMEVFRIIEMLPSEESPAIEVFFEELSTVARNLRASFEEEAFPVMNRVKYLLVLFTMRKILGNAKYSNTRPGDELKIALLDLPLSKMLPEQYAQILKVFQENVDADVENLLKSHEVLKFYAEPQGISDEKSIDQGLEILEAFAIHENMDLIERTFKAVIKSVPLYAGNRQLRKKADALLMRMFCHHSSKVRIFTYQESANAMKKYFACLLNGECAYVGQNNLKLVENHILGFPLTAELLTEIATSGFEDATLRKLAEDILFLPVKGRPMLGEEGWTKMLDILLPNIPLYQCLTQSPKITEGILKLLDPDANCLPRLEIIRGNLRFLFHPDADIRSEALARIIYILTSHSGAGAMLPNLMEISDILPNDCCLLEVPRDIDRIFCGGFYEPSIVPNLMQLLMASDVEPQIRKTVLMQLNVVGQEVALNRLIFDAGGWMTCLQSLQGALYKQSHTDYPDSVVPIVGILSKLLFCDGQFRQELAKEENVFILLTRSLFLYVNDITLKQDVSLCLFLLLYSSVIVGTKTLTVPKVLKNLRLPVKCQLQSTAACSGKKTVLEKLYLGDETPSTGDLKSTQCFIRMTIADLRFKGGLENAKPSTEYTPSLTKSDLRLIKSTSMTENITKFLKYASNATEHEQIMDSITSMRLIQLLCGGNAMSSDLVTKTFKRFILNTNQLVLLEDTVELFSTLVQVNNETIITWLLSILGEEQTPLLRLLSNETETSLSLHRKICGLLSEVFQRAPPTDQSQSRLELEVFDTLMSITEEHFKNRDLDRTRCVLGVLQVISGRRSLQKLLSRKQVHSTCKKLFFFTIALKSFTQTGSDLQKNALLIISSLSAITPDFQLNGTYLKYLSGLGGHNDYQVRTLAWCILARIAKSEEGAEALIRELDFLPGGFRACCLSTLLDQTEVAMVRQLAGLLFADLLNNGTQFDKVHEIVQKHDFYRIALASLKYFYPGELISTADHREEITTCDIVRAYSKICIQLIELKSSFCAELCKKPIMGKLYQLVKCPPAKEEQQKSFASMVGEICNLYSRFSRSHLAFLQTTLCRDHDFLNYLCSFLCTSHPQQHLMSMLNLLMVLSKDQIGFQYICESFAGNSEKIIKLVTVSLETSLSISLLQPTCLAFITFLLIKCQQRNVEHECFSDTLETTITDSTQMKYAAQVLFLQLNKLLLHNYPLKTAKFDSPPSALKVLLCEAIAVLLKTSEKARITAKNIKFLDKILLIFNSFLESIQVPCTTFVRRYSEAKKLAVIKHLSLLYGIILNWFSVDVLTDELQVVELTKVLIQTWPWQNHSNDIRILYLKSLAFLSEKSVPVCRQFSVPTSSNANTLLQMLLKLLTMETNKVKSLDSNSTALIKIGLRTVMNCCSCQEGRMALIKLHALDIIDSVHPFNPKIPKSKNDILVAWLSFWELFSRYPEGAVCRNIIGLCTVINKCHDPTLRLIGLKILRNMTFLPNNRTNLLASADFLYTVNNIITNSECYSERLVTCTALWRLISGGAKYAATIKNTKMTKKLNAILEDLTGGGGELHHSSAANRCQAKDLANVIEIILRILNS
ncbi:protein rotatin homolog [Eupeodes corollae]|uniref:protein rotatin homolog n=1 Tax=Eupeodes corollae TaxID=290404 RepID=UPI002492FCCD|nr:protein rotatin homolog [Eupeodes corollae]